MAAKDFPYRLGQKFHFKGYQWAVEDFFDGEGTPVPSEVTLTLVSKPWYLIFSTLAHEVTLKERRWHLLEPVQEGKPATKK